MANTKYKKEYADELVEYFMKFLRGESDDGAVYPSMVRFADKIGVTTRTLTNWRDKNKLFAEAYSFAQEIQDEVLNEKALVGDFDGRVAMKIRELKINSQKAAIEEGGGARTVITLKDDDNEQSIEIKKWVGEINEDTEY